MILVGRFMSPYVRRVAVSMATLGLPFERIVLNAITEAPKVREYNPIGRVPILILDDGERLIESAAILDYLQELEGERRILAASGPDRRQALQLAAIMTNTLEKAIYAFYETFKRPAALVHPPVLEGLQNQARAGLRMLEQRAGEGWLVGGHCTIADITGGVGWRFLSLFAPHLADAASYPRLAAHSVRCEALPAFAACQPETA